MASNPKGTAAEDKDPHPIQKICPIMSPRIRHHRPDIINYMNDCVGERCAIWHEMRACCLLKGVETRDLATIAGAAKEATAEAIK